MGELCAQNGYAATSISKPVKPVGCASAELFHL